MKLVNIASAGLLVLSAIGVAGVASAAPTGTVTFTQPTGAAAGNVDIAVYFTVALDSNSAAIRTDASGNVTSGVTTADLLAAGIDPALVDHSDVNTSFQCSGSFTTGCGGPPYDFDFGFGANALNFAQGLDIEAGTSTDFLFGTFVPTGGSAPSGSYAFYDASVFAQYYDAAGNHLGDVTFFDTCGSRDASCAFQRDVTGVAAVPEPASWALMVGGFGIAGAAVRRRRRIGLRFV